MCLSLRFYKVFSNCKLDCLVLSTRGTELYTFLLYNFPPSTISVQLYFSQNDTGSITYVTRCGYLSPWKYAKLSPLSLYIFSVAVISFPHSLQNFFPFFTCSHSPSYLLFPCIFSFALPSWQFLFNLDIIRSAFREAIFIHVLKTLSYLLWILIPKVISLRYRSNTNTVISCNYSRLSHGQIASSSLRFHQLSLTPPAPLTPSPSHGLNILLACSNTRERHPRKKILKLE